MATDSLKKVLDRDLAKASVSDLADLISPLLREVVNHATYAFVRCQQDVTGEEGVDFPAFILYRHVIELTDAVEVLLADSCVPPAIPLLRSSLESSLGLEYILSGSPSEFRRRARSWLCVYTHKRLGLYDLVEPDREIPRKRRKGESIRGSVKAGVAKANLEKALTEPDMEPIEQEYQTICNGRRKDPAWYSLFGGPNNLRELAKHLGQEKHYTHLYKFWSTYSHGGDASTGFSKSSSGGVAFKVLRSPEMLLPLAHLAVLFQLHATRLVVEKFRPGENLCNWYLEEIKPRHDALRTVQIDIEEIEWGNV